MIVKFFIDPETDLPHIHNHSVTEAKVREILARPGLVLKGRENSVSVRPTPPGVKDSAGTCQRPVGRSNLAGSHRLWNWKRRA
jgi:hypothetical protein